MNLYAESDRAALRSSTIILLMLSLVLVGQVLAEEPVSPGSALSNAVNKSADEDRSTVNLVLLEKSLIRVIMEVLSQLLGIIWLYSIELIVAE